MEIIGYVAPSPVAGIEDQITRLRAAGVREDRYIRVDRPGKKGAALPRAERDFVFGHMLRRAIENPDGEPDRLAVVSLDVLADTRGEVLTLFKTLHGLGVPLVSVADGLDPDLPATEYAVRWVKALERAERRWRQHRAAQAPRKARRRPTGATGRPAALTAADVGELVTLRQVERMTWPRIKEVFRGKGCQVGESTLRRYYAEAVAAPQEPR